MDALELLEYNPELDTNHVHCEPTGAILSASNSNRVVVYGLDGVGLPIEDGEN